MSTSSPPTTARSPQAISTNSPSPSQVQLRQPSSTFVTRSKTWLSSQVGVASFCIAVVALVVAITCVFPTFMSQHLSEKALDIAEWTALKDFREQCIEYLAAGLPSPNCEEAIDKPLPPPPHVEIAPPPHIHPIPQRRFIDYSVNVATASIGSFMSRVNVSLLVLGLCLMSAAIFVLKSRKKLANRVLPSHSEGQSTSLQPNTSSCPTVSIGYLDDSVSTSLSAPPQCAVPPPHNDAVTTSSHPSDSSTRLRHREMQARTAPSSRKFACPFFIYDPAKYETFNACSDPLSRMMTIDEVLLHLFMHHYRSQWCQYCRRALQNETSFDGHQCCTGGVRREDSPDCSDPVDKAHWELLGTASKEMQLTDEERWKEWYRILFGLDSTAGVPSPYC
ncbi:hypothetical protein EDB80DRAFT_895489 [Ilyonectria destructans]|nr:hypothetical protein EDB80DRAFT_895489 [Ilyonectria destructans]